MFDSKASDIFMCRGFYSCDKKGIRQGYWEFNWVGYMRKGYYLNGIKIGYWEYYHINDKLYCKGNFVNGNKNGNWLYYNIYGHLATQEYYL